MTEQSSSNSKSRSPLFGWVFSKSVNMIRRHLEQGGSANATATHMTVLQYLAARFKSTDPDYRDIAQLLLKHGADLHARTNEGKTVVHFASDDASTLEYFVQQGADITAVDASGWTALHHTAARANNAETMREMLQVWVKLGADPWARDHQRRTPEDISPHKEVLKELRSWRLERERHERGAALSEPRRARRNPRPL